MGSDLCYKNIQLIPQWLFAANDACFFLPENGLEKIFLIFVRMRFFMLHFMQQQSMMVLLLNSIIIMNSDYLCPYTSKISVWQCEMTGNVMECEGSELKW